MLISWIASLGFNLACVCADLFSGAARMFDVANIDLEKNIIKFGRGGFQGARGGPGSDWFISNVLQELDEPREFYFDRAADMLYVMANESVVGAGNPPANATYEGLEQHTLIHAEGSAMDKPITDVTLRGLGFRDTAPTYMKV